MFDDLQLLKGLEKIVPLLPRALNELQGLGPLRLVDLRESSKASAVHDFAMEEGMRRFQEDSEIQVTEAKGLRYFSFGKHLVRIKHAKPNLQIAINDTAQTQQWQQGVLEGWSDPRLCLHLVYVPDLMWETISRCVIAEYSGISPRNYYDISVDGWYSCADSNVQRYSPDQKLPPLSLQPGVISVPLELREDGTS